MRKFSKFSKSLLLYSLCCLNYITVCSCTEDEPFINHDNRGKEDIPIAMLTETDIPMSYQEKMDSNILQRKESMTEFELSSEYSLLDWIGDNLNWNPNGNTIEINTTTPLDKDSIVSSTEWLTWEVKEKEGAKNYSYDLTLYADLNKEQEGRRANIIIHHNGSDKLLTIDQLGIIQYPQCPESFELSGWRSSDQDGSEYIKFSGYCPIRCNGINLSREDISIVFPEEVDWINETRFMTMNNNLYIETIHNPPTRKLSTNIELRIRSHVFDKSYLIGSIEIVKPKHKNP